MGIFRVVHAAGRIAWGAGANIVGGAVATAGDACQVLKKAVQGDWEGSLETVGERLEKTAVGACVAVDNTLALLEDLGSGEGDFLREENIRRFTSVATVGLVAAAGAGLVDVDVDGDDAGTAVQDPDAVSVPDDAQAAAQFGIPADAIENGVFTGDESDLAALICAGEDPDAVHVDSEDVSRDMDIRDAFLAAHGYDGVPSGFEVHHVMPLSEGGSDAPSNMLLVSEDEHDQITAAHRDFYNW